MGKRQPQTNNKSALQWVWNILSGIALFVTFADSQTIRGIIGYYVSDEFVVIVVANGILVLLFATFVFLLATTIGRMIGIRRRDVIGSIGRQSMSAQSNGVT